MCLGNILTISIKPRSYCLIFFTVGRIFESANSWLKKVWHVRLFCLADFHSPFDRNRLTVVITLFENWQYEGVIHLRTYIDVPVVWNRVEHIQGFRETSTEGRFLYTSAFFKPILLGDRVQTITNCMSETHCNV